MGAPQFQGFSTPRQFFEYSPTGMRPSEAVGFSVWIHPLISMNVRPCSLLTAALLMPVLLATSGCISSHQTVTVDAPRTTVAFVSERAGRLFYETLAGKPDSLPREEKRTHVNLILIDVQQRTVVGPNRRFNEAVHFCDSNHDAVITETEAEVFSAAWPAANG
jgi:hypothetical protein